MSYSYKGNPVFVPCNVEIPKSFRPGKSGPLFEVFQEALNTIEPWNMGDDPIETIEIPYKIGARAVKLTTHEDPIWQINLSENAKDREVTPHIELSHDDERRLTNKITVELKSLPKHPLLMRAYPGEYIPPLPSLLPANAGAEAFEESLDYWNTHALLYNQRCTPGDLQKPPSWYGRII